MLLWLAARARSSGSWLWLVAREYDSIIRYSGSVYWLYLSLSSYGLAEAFNYLLSEVALGRYGLDDQAVDLG